MESSIEIRRLRPSQIDSHWLDSFEHRQVLSNVWVKKGAAYESVQVNEIREWSPEKRSRLSRYLLDQAGRGGAVIGAFAQGRLVGFAALDGGLRGETAKYANLTMLFVDDRWKRRGIGRRLFSYACRCARHISADKLFISAVPSCDTVAFYFSMGCTDAAEGIDEFADTQEDRYMEYDLRAWTENG